MAKKNNAHTFDFTGILNAEINQQDWKEKKKLLEDQFGKFKMALDTDLAEAEAQKILDMFNEKLNIQLNVEQVKKDAEAVKKIIENALASINNIDTSALRGVEDTLKDIATTTDKIFNKINGNAQNAFNNIEQGAKKASKSAIKSVGQVEAALKRVGKGTDAFKDIQNTVKGKFEIKNKGYTKTEAQQVIGDIAQQRKTINENPNATWEQKYAADIKFVDAYKGYKVKFGQLSDEAEGLYKSLLDTYYDQKNMLQNIVNMGKSTKKNPKPLVGYDGGEPWARETTLKEVRDILKGGIRVSDDGGGNKPSSNNPPATQQGVVDIEKELKGIVAQFVGEYNQLLNDWGDAKINDDEFDAQQKELIAQTSGKLKANPGFNIQQVITDAMADGASSSELFKILKDNVADIEVPIKPVIEPKVVQEEINKSTSGKSIEVPIEPVVNEDLDKKKTRLATINRALTDINPSDKVRDNKDTAEYWYSRKYEENGSAYEGLIKYVEAYNKVKSSGSKDQKWLDQYMPTEDDLAKYKSVKEKLIQEKQQLETELSTTTVKPLEGAKLIDLYFAATHHDPEVSEFKLSKALQNNPNLIQELTSQRDGLQARLSPIDDTVQRISKGASIKGLSTDQLKQEAANVGKQISTMYDEGITDTEEYVTLQYKLLNIYKELEKVYGGIKNSGAKNHTEYRNWISDSIEQATGFNPMTEQVIDSLWGQRDFSIMKTNEQSYKMREMAGKIQGNVFSELDYHKLSDLNVVIDALNKIPQVAASTTSAHENLDTKTSAVGIDETALGNAIANALKGVQLNTNTQGEVKASIDATELKNVLDKITYNVKVIGEKTLVDNYGDEVANTLMKNTQLLDEQGRIIKLFHNSSNVFDKFNSSIGSKQGKTLGAGNYLALTQNSKYNSLDFGRFQTEWYANVEKVFDNQNDILPKEKIVALINKYLPELTGDAVENFLGNFIKGFTAQGVKYLAQKANVSSLAIWNDLGYDAVKDKDQINVFDSSKLQRANNSVLDVETGHRTVENNNSSTLTEIKDILKSIKTNTDKLIDPRAETLKNEIRALNTKQPNDLFEYGENQKLITDKENELNNLGSKSINYAQIATALVQIASVLTTKTIEAAIRANTNAVETFTQHLSGQTSYFESLQQILGGIADAFKQSNVSTTIITTGNVLEALNNTLNGVSRLVVVPTGADITPQQIGVNPVSLTEKANGLSKRKILTDADGKPKRQADTVVERTSNAVKTKTQLFEYDKAGNPIPSDILTVEDFDKFIKEQKSERQKIDAAKAKLKEFLAQFNNKTLGKGEQISGYNELGELLSTDWKLDTIEEAKQGMLALNAEFNKLTQNFRKGSSSLNPFVNAINNSDKLRSQIQNIQVDFTSLKDTEKSRKLVPAVAGLEKEFNAAQKLLESGDIEGYSVAYGNLREKIVKVVNEIRTLRKEQGVTQKSALFDENKDVISARSDTQVQEWERMSYIPDELRDKFRLLYSELNNVVDQDELNIWKKQWEQIRVQITALRREHQGMEADLKEVLAIYEEIGRNEAKIEGLQSEGEKDVYRKRNLALEKEAQELAKIYGLNVDLAAIEKARTDAKNSGMVRVDAAQERKTLNERIKAERKAARINASNAKWNAGQNTLLSLWKIDDDNIDLNKIPEIKLLQKELDKLSKTQKLVNEEIQKFGKSNHTKALNDQTRDVTELTAAVKELVSNYERFSGPNADDKLGSFTGGDWETQITKAIQTQYPGAKIKSINHDLQEVTYELKTGARAFTEYTAGIRQADNKIVALKGTTKKLPTFLEGVKRKLGEISQYFSAMSLINRAMQELRKGVQYVKEIDLALTELKKVTDETEATYDKFLDTAAKTGARLGTPISAVIEATATFAKLGYTMKQASEMAEAAIVYKNVGDGIASTEDAADSIISTLKGFGMEASETMRIVDRFNEVGNRFAITSKGIGEALRLSASALNEGGNSLDESIALITAANEVVNDPSSVGTALKTLTLRLRGSKTELEEMGEDVSDMAKTTSQLQAKLLALTGGKVDIMLDANTFKNSTQILREMADAWSSMDDISRASALELMGGKRQANVLSALIQNFDTAEEVIKTSANSTGSALKENEKYLDSIQGKIDQFTNAVQTMWKNTLDDGTVKWFVNIATQLVKWLDTLGPIKTLLAGIAVYLNKKYNFIDFSGVLGGFKEAFTHSKGPKDFFKNLISGFKNTEISIDKAKAKMEELEVQKAKLGDPKSEKNRRKIDALDQEINKYKEMLKPSQELVAAQDKLTKAQNRFNNAKAKEKTDKALKPETVKRYEREVNKAKTEVDNLTNAQKTAGKSGTGAFKSLGKSVKNFAVSIGKALLQMAAMMLVMKLLALAKEWIDSWVTTAEEAAEAFEELTNELKNTKNELEGINDELKTLDDKIAELTAKGKWSFTEQDELERLKAERAELERELALQEDIAKIQQQSVNAQTPGQVEYYKNKGVNSGKTVNENVHTAGSTALVASGVASGAVAAGAISAAATAAGGIAALGASQIWNPIGWALLATAAITTVVAGIAWAVAEGEETVGESIDNYEENIKKKEEEVAKAREKYRKSGKESDREEYENKQKELANYKAETLTHLQEIKEMYDNMDLSQEEDPERMAQLKKDRDDFYNDYDRVMIENGSEGAVSNAINRVFDKKENKKAKEEIEALMKQLKEDPGNTAIEQKIKDIINGSETLKSDFEAIGIELNTVANSFTQMAEDQAFGTIDGKVKELERATTIFNNLLNGGRFNFEGQNIGIADLFTDEGEVVQTKLSEIFKGTSAETREAITGLLERSYDDIQNGTVNIETLLGEFASRGSEAILSILEETSDTFEEISENMDKIQSSYSTLSNAVEQYNSAGFLTLDNLQSLLSLEPEYLALLQMENGQLTINQAGYEALVQTKLAEAKASVVQSAMKQLNALAAKKEATATNEASTAAANSISNLGTYASALSDVAKNAIGAASSVYAFNNAVAGAQANELVTQDEIDAILNSMDTQLQMIDSVGANLSTNFGSIMTGGEGGNPKDGGEDSDEFEELLRKHQNELDAIAHEKDLIQAEIDEAEAKGFTASEEHYNRLIALEQQEKDALIRHQQELQNFYNANSASMSADEIDKWNAEMRATALAIKEADKNMIEFGNTIREIGEEYFDKVSEDIDAINEEIEFMHGLLEDEPVADENGNWSNESLTRLGLYTQQMEKAAFETQRAQAELDELRATTSEADKNTDWYREREEELTQAIYDGVNSYNDAKDGIVELNEARVEAIKEGIEKEIEAYNDLIENKKEALDAERDLYDFKKNIEEQNKSIADTERKLAALSGSTAAEDIAERKRLEADLRKQQGDLDDTYYDHSMTAQQNALDEEGRYFEEAQQRRIESLEAMLENTEELIVNSMMDVMLNADTVHNTLNEQANTYGVTLSEELTKPWLDASAQAIAWRDELKRDMTEGEWAAMIGEGGAITAFSNGVATKLGGSWDTVKTKTKAYSDFLTGTELKNNLSGAVTTFTTYLQKIVDKWNEIRNAAVAATSVTPTVPSSGSGGTGGDSGGNPTPSPSPTPTPKEEPKVKLRGLMQTSREMILGSKSFVDANTETINGTKYYRDSNTGYYYKISDLNSNRKYDGGRTTGWAIPKGTWFYTKHAQGTLGTTKDEWAITDEPQFGDELVLVPGKDGNLSFMRKGTGVVPADMTQKLFELAQIPTSDLMSKSITAIVPNITKNEFKNEFNFDSLVHVDHCDQNTLKDLEKMVDNKINQFGKQMNYALKSIK